MENLQENYYKGVLIILRGVSGSGKTTLAKTLEESLPDAIAYAADDFFYDNENGVYEFNRNELPLAHEWCQNSVMVVMDCGVQNIIIHNTNTTEKEIEPYLQLADKFRYKVVSLIVENRHGNHNVHDVPHHIIGNQEKRLRQSIKLK